ncbi:MAG: SUMF1/EgtB/PvdO family nonheme iron enzyme [Pirellulaceae bacterium]
MGRLGVRAGPENVCQLDRNGRKRPVAPTGVSGPGATSGIGAANTGGEKWSEHDGHVYAAPAVSFEQSAAESGCLNMAGNVAEWTAEGFVAGGSSNNNPTQVRLCGRSAARPDFRAFDVGFRCVRSGGDAE